MPFAVVDPVGATTITTAAGGEILEDESPDHRVVGPVMSGLQTHP